MCNIKKKKKEKSLELKKKKTQHENGIFFPAVYLKELN